MISTSALSHNVCSIGLYAGIPMKLKVTVAGNGLGFDDYSSDIFIPCSFLQLNVLLSIKDLSKFNIA